MKTILMLFIGLCIGFCICYFMMPLLGLSHPSLDQAKTQTIAPTQPKYSHDEEGNRMQTLEMLDIEEYASTEGNSAELFAIGDSCKIRVNIVGETHYRYRTFFMKQGQLVHAMQTLYRYPYGGLTNMNSPNAFQEELYSEEVFNPESTAVLAEFKELLGRFSPHYLTKC